MKKILATVLVAMFMSFTIAPAFAQQQVQDPYVQLLLNNEQKKDTAGKGVGRFLRDVVFGGIGALALGGGAKLAGADRGTVRALTMIGGGGGAVVGEAVGYKENKKADLKSAAAAVSIRARADQIRKEDHDFQSENNMAVMEAKMDAKFAEQKADSFQAKYEDLERKMAERSSSSSSSRGGDNVVINAGIGASQAPTMMTVENCLPAQFKRTEVFDDYVGAWRRLATRERRSIATTDPETAPRARTWWTLPGGGEGWVELKVGDGIARISTGYWRIQ